MIAIPLTDKDVEMLKSAVQNTIAYWRNTNHNHTGMGVLAPENIRSWSLLLEKLEDL